MRIIIFLPSYVFQKTDMYLYGVLDKEESDVKFYVLGSSCSSRCLCLNYYKIIGRISNSIVDVKRTPSKYWFHIGLKKPHLSLQSICLNGQVISEYKSISVTLLVYPYKDFIASKIFRYSDFVYGDFKFLVTSLQSRPTVECCNLKSYTLSDNIIVKISCNCISKIMSLILILLYGTKIKFLLQLTSFGSHLFNVIENLEYVLSHIGYERYVSIKCVNYIIARIVDCLFGQLLITILMYYTTQDNLFVMFTHTEQTIVKNMYDVVTWLMKEPAGMKLNDEFSLILGLFFQFHISLWWTFLIVMKPVLRTIFNICLFFGYFGISFQAAILNDLITLVGVHVYCFYVYAARLYYYQLISLVKLIRMLVCIEDDEKYSVPIFRSHRYIVKIEHLFFCTISFTTVLFLLPTTAVYYGMFAFLRLTVIFCGGVLTRIRYLFDIFPLYVFWLWFRDGRTLKSGINVLSDHQFVVENASILVLKPVFTSNLNTILLCVLDGVIKPPSIQWSRIIVNFLIGGLFYRM